MEMLTANTDSWMRRRTCGSFRIVGKRKGLKRMWGVDQKNKEKRGEKWGPFNHSSNVLFLIENKKLIYKINDNC